MTDYRRDGRRLRGKPARSQRRRRKAARPPVADPFPSLTADDINRAAKLLGLRHRPQAEYQPDGKAGLVGEIRAAVRRLRDAALRSGGLARTGNPGLEDFLRRADRHWPEGNDHARPSPARKKVLAALRERLKARLRAK